MHFSTTLLLSSLFSFSLALPALEPESVKGLPSNGDVPREKNGRFDVSYNFITYKTLSSGGSGSGSGKSSLSPVGASDFFTIKAYNSIRPIHMMDIVVSNNKWYIGNITTNSSCPQTIPNCPVGNVTALRVTNAGGAQLDAGIPGGQAVYVGPNQDLRFGNAREPIPQDATKVEFALTVNPIPALPAYSFFVFSGVGKASGYLACPIKPGGPWQVFVGLSGLMDDEVPSGDKSDCIGFDAAATNYTSPTPAAYQYI
ncbi:MAG: hypothetical protein Q9219_004423 [cf. Caloplaca sp. 3 TL-2023]